MKYVCLHVKGINNYAFELNQYELIDKFMENIIYKGLKHHKVEWYYHDLLMNIIM